MSVKLLTEHHLEYLSLKGDCRGSSKATLVKNLEISCGGSNVCLQAVLVIVLVCSAGLGEERRRKKRSSSSDDSTPQSSSSSESSWSLETLSSSDLSPLSQSSSSHNSPKGKKRPGSCLKRQFRRRRGCEKVSTVKQPWPLHSG